MVGAQFSFFAFRHKPEESWLSGLKQNHFVFCLEINMLELSDGDRMMLTTLHTFWNANTFLHMLFHCTLCIWPKAPSCFLFFFSPSHLRLGYQALPWPVPCYTPCTETSVHSRSNHTKPGREISLPSIINPYWGPLKEVTDDNS